MSQSDDPEPPTQTAAKAPPSDEHAAAPASGQVSEDDREPLDGTRNLKRANIASRGRMADAPMAEMVPKGVDDGVPEGIDNVTRTSSSAGHGQRKTADQRTNPRSPLADAHRRGAFDSEGTEDAEDAENAEEDAAGGAGGQDQPTRPLAAASPGQNLATAAGKRPHPSRKKSPVLPAGTRIGRYVITERLGAGGMGVVYKAFDPQLSRSIAIKLLPMAKRRAQSRTRLLREAQALAQLSHPNIVTIYDSGEFEGDVFIAMELVQGRNLAQWLTDKLRSQSEILAAFLEAAKGLSAVHHTGLIHRDFKPANVMVGDDGRVRILDFGLVRMIQESTEERDLSGSAESSVSGTGTSRTPLDTDLTRTGALLGTPAYMAPEQFVSEPTQAKTDQFAFCISLYEALYGERPYAGQSLSEIMSAVLGGVIRPAPRDAKVPPWIRAVLLRGLQIAPADRWPSMDALIAALHKDPAARRRSMARTALVGAMLAATGAGAALYVAAGPEPCTGGRQQMASVWGDAQHQAVLAAITATGVSYAKDTEELLRTRLDHYADDWVAAYTDACEATAVRKEQSQEILDQRMACLNDRRQALGELVNVLSEDKANATVARNAVQAAVQLPRIDACADLEYVRARIKPPDDPALLPLVDEARAKLARAGHLLHTGAYDDALTLASQVKETASKLDYPPLDMEADVQLGIAHSKQGRYEEAVKALERAFFAAQAIRHDEVAITASIRLVLELGFYLDHFDDALRWAQHAEAALALHGTEHQRATLLSHRGLTLGDQGKLEESERLHREALAKVRAVLSPDHVDIGHTYNDIGLVLMLQGKDSEAEAMFREAATLFERILGSEHPILINVLSNVANTLRNQGNYDDAQRYYERSLKIAMATVGEEHVDTALCLNNLGISAHFQGKYKEAEDYYRRALAIREKVLGPEHTSVAHSLEDLGAALSGLGDQAGAEAHYRRALAIREKVLGPEHADVAHALSNIGRALADQNKYAEAEEHQRRALAIQEKVLGKTHPDLTLTLSALGTLATQRGQYDKAEEYLHRALVITETTYGPEHQDLIRTLQSLAYLSGVRDEIEKAEGYLRRVLAIEERELGKDHPNLAWALTSLGISRNEVGDHEGAKAYFERALANIEGAHGKDHHEAAMVLDSLGQVAQDQGQYQDAERYYQRALAARTNHRGPGDTDRAYSLIGLAKVHLSRKEHAAALKLAEEAAALWPEDRAPSPTSLAELRFVRAQASYAAGSGTDRAKALELARQAEATYLTAGNKAEAAEVATWLARRGK